MGKTFNKDTVGLCTPISGWMTFQGRRTICCFLQQDGEATVKVGWWGVVGVRQGASIAVVGLAPVISTVCSFLLSTTVCWFSIHPSATLSNLDINNLHLEIESTMGRIHFWMYSDRSETCQLFR